MSSSSSSECLCPDCIQFGTSFRTVRARNPFYQGLGQPLIYYARMKQSPQLCGKRCRETRKCEPNCFVKAFRWYTQEHKLRRSSSRSRPRENPGLSEFAMWLDKKYVEFLQENENCDCSLAKPNTAPPCCEDNKTITSASPAPPCDTCQTKFFARVRSPWRKKHRSKEQSSTVEKRLQSLEFILEPKDLSRPASEFYQQTPPTKQSGVSVVSSESQISKKTVVKTRTLEKKLSDKKLKSFEIDRNEGPNIGRHQEPLKSPPPPQGSKQYCIAKDVSCQCPETKLVKIDTQTQYYDSDWAQKDYSSTAYYSAGNSSNLQSGSTRQVCDKTAIHPKPSKFVLKDIEKKQSNTACQCTLYEVPKNDTACACQDTKKYRNVECHCVLVPTAYEWNDASKDKEVPCKEASVITRCVNYPCEQITIQKSLKTSENQTSTGKNRNIICSFKTARQDSGLQTSDNAIDLERDGVRKYPLFMKIVYADKLKEERPRM